MSLEQKNARLALLVADQGLLVKSVVILRDNGHFDAADKLQDSVDHITLAIEVFSAQTLEEWIVLSQVFESSVAPLRNELKAQIDIIKKDLKTAKSVTKAVSTIDKAVQKILEHVT